MTTGCAVPFGNLCQRQFWIILRKSFQKCNMLSLYIYTHNMMICIFIFLSNVIIFYCPTRHVQIEFWRIVPLHIDVSWEGRVVQGSPNETTDLDLLSMVSYVHWLIRYIKLWNLSEFVSVKNPWISTFTRRRSIFQQVPSAFELSPGFLRRFTWPSGAVDAPMEETPEPRRRRVVKG